MPTTLPARDSGVRPDVRTAAVTAGAGLVVMTLLSVFGVFLAVRGLVTEGDAAATAADVTSSLGLFRAGVASILVVIALDVVVAVALYRVLRPADARLSAVAAALRLAYAAGFLVAVVPLVQAARTGSDAFARIESFEDRWNLALGVFGLHLLMTGYVAFRSGYVPRWVGVAVALAGLGYAIDTVRVLLLPDSSFDVAGLTAVGEFVLAVWLLVRGRTLGDPASDASRTADVPVGATR